MSVEFDDFQKAMVQLGYKESDMNLMDYDVWKSKHASQYNMDEEALQTLWEGEQHKIQNKFLKVLDLVEEQQQKQIEEKQQEINDFYIPSMFENLINCRVIQNEKEKLKKFRQAQIKEVRKYILMHAKQIQDFEKQLLKDDLKQLSKPYKEPRPPLIQFKESKEIIKNGEQKFFVGLDKLQPKALLNNLFEQNIQIEDTNNYDKPIVIEPPPKKGNQYQQVLERNTQQLEIKRQKQEQKMQEQEQKLEDLQKTKKKQVQFKSIQNTLNQQDKQENIKRQQIVFDYNIGKLEKKLMKKDKKVKQFKQQRNELRKNEDDTRRQVELYQEQVNFISNLAEEGKYDTQQVMMLINQQDPLRHFKIMKMKREKENISYPKSARARSTRLEQQIINLQAQQEVEFKLLIQREMIAEQSRSQINPMDQDMVKLFERQRIQAQKRIQSCVDKQNSEMNTLKRLYK
ncbi:hypothetical protein pb186bvf_019495 [Paramecium bursaria]